MRIGMIKRLHITYVFWKTLGDKNSNTVMALVHEDCFADIASGYLDPEDAEAINSDFDSIVESNSVGGYDHGHKTA